MQYTDYINSRSLFEIIRRSCNYVDSRLIDHGLRVAGLVSRMLLAGGCHEERVMRDISLMAMLHDIGAYRTDEINRLLLFDSDQVMNHSIYGYLFFKYFSPVKSYAPAILRHHEPWRTLKDDDTADEGTKLLAQLIHTADRIDILMDVKGMSSQDALKVLEQAGGAVFAPEILGLARQCDFHLTAEELSDPESLYSLIFSGALFSPEEVIDYLKLLIYNIDFRSRHTVTHTITTTSISYELALLSGLSDEEVNQILCGALLHDVGKIGVPMEILEYPGKLSPQAMTVMRSHVDITEKIFGGDIDPVVADIALRHHEKLDGSGYPRGLAAQDLTTAQRIVAISDIVSALAGTRSYKEAYSKDRIISIITKTKEAGQIDPDISDLVIEHFDQIMENTGRWTRPVLTVYQTMQEECDDLCRHYGCAIPESPVVYS